MAFTIFREQTGDYMRPVTREPIEQMPLYGVERAVGLDDRLPSYTITPQGNRIRFKLAFRTYDDDGILCHEGELDDDDDCTNQTAALRFSESSIGAVRIEVRRGSKWVQELG